MLNEIKNLGKAVVKHAANGFKKVELEVYRERLAVCEACDQNKDWKCDQCGCYLTVKADWASEHCPLGKWAGDGNVERKPIKQEKACLPCGAAKKAREAAKATETPQPSLISHPESPRETGEQPNS